jgi:hypothetical protein
VFNNHPPQPRLPTEDFEVRIWGFVVVVVTLVLAGIVAFMLYSLAFVTQPIKTMAPMDQAFAKMLNDIVLLIVGGIGGVMSKKGVQAVADKMSPPPAPGQPVTVAAPSGTLPVWTNPVLDEEWRAPPPPTTPPNYVDPAHEEIANERAAAKLETA